MKKLTISAAAILAGAIAAPGVASAEPYVNFGYTQFSADDVDVGGVTGRLGYKFTPHFGVEGEATFGVDNDTADFLGTPVEVELNHQYGVYGIGFLPVGETVELFGRVGYAQIDAEGSVGPFTAGVEDEGVGFGGGAQWNFTPALGVRAEYTRLEGEDDGVNAWGVSGAFKF
jgi:opacity protein-like surface antigen